MTGTPAPTETPTPTEVPPSFTADEWASDKETGKVDSRQMFPLVGAINHVNRKTIDVGFKVGSDSLKIAMVTSNDFTTEEDHRSYREEIAATLDRNETLKQQLIAIREQLAQRYPNERDSRNFIAVVEDGRVTQAIYIKKDIPERYAAIERADGIALQEIKEYPLLPELHVNGPYIETDEGVRVQFKGVEVYTFADGPQTFEDAMENIELARRLLGPSLNIIRFQLDVGRSFRPEMLKKAVAYAERLGMYVLLCPVEEDGKPFVDPSQPTEPQPTEKSIQVLAELAEMFKGRFHVWYQLFNELGRVQGDRWYDGLIRSAEAVTSVNPNAILGLPGWAWGVNFSRFQREPFPFKNCFASVYYYGPVEPLEKTDFLEQWQWEWMKGNMPVIFPEAGVPNHVGARDNPLDAKYINEMLAVVRDHPYMTHWIAFKMAPPNWRVSLVGPGSRTTLSTRGAPYGEDLRDPNSTPPTDFSK